MNGFARIEGGEIVPVEKILGLNPSDKERQRIEETEGALLGHQLTANVASEFPLKTTNREFVFSPRPGRNWITRRPHRHTGSEEKVAEASRRIQMHVDKVVTSHGQAINKRGIPVEPTWRFKLPPVIEIEDSPLVVDNEQDTYGQCDQRRRGKQKTSEPAIYDGILVTGISPDKLLAFLGSYQSIYTRYAEQAGLIERICPSSNQVAAKGGARVLRLSEVDPGLLDISKPI